MPADIYPSPLQVVQLIGWEYHVHSNRASQHTLLVNITGPDQVTPPISIAGTLHGLSKLRPFIHLCNYWDSTFPYVRIYYGSTCACPIVHAPTPPHPALDNTHHPT